MTREAEILNIVYLLYQGLLYLAALEATPSSQDAHVVIAAATEDAVLVYKASILWIVAHTANRQDAAT
jgi:hypothetical protein